MSHIERRPARALGAEPPYPTRDLNVLAATLAAGEIGSEHAHRWPHLEKWELDWAVADPIGYLDRRVPTWLRGDLSLTEPLPDLDPRRRSVCGKSVATRA